MGGVFFPKEDLRGDPRKKPKHKVNCKRFFFPQTKKKRRQKTPQKGVLFGFSVKSKTEKRGRVFFGEKKNLFFSHKPGRFLSRYLEPKVFSTENAKEKKPQIAPTKKTKSYIGGNGRKSFGLRIPFWAPPLAKQIEKPWGAP